MNCIEKIIGVKNPCGNDEYVPLSPYYINDYPGITIQTSANIADEKTTSGYEFMKLVIRDSMRQLEADVLSYIYSNYNVNSINKNQWVTGKYKMPHSIIDNGDIGKERGLLIKRKMKNCKLEKLTISSIKIFTNFSGITILKISDVDYNISKSVKIELEACMINTFILNYSIKGDNMLIQLPANIPMYHTGLYCGSGCSGTPISDCVEVYGIYNNITNKSEGYGIIAEIQCKCDISSLLCDMATDGLITRAAYELCGATFYDYMSKTNRLNYMTIYKSEEIKEQAKAGFDAYRGYLLEAFKGFKNYIVRKDGGCKCIDCNSLKIQANI